MVGNFFADYGIQDHILHSDVTPIKWRLTSLMVYGLHDQFFQSNSFAYTSEAPLSLFWHHAFFDFSIYPFLIH